MENCGLPICTWLLLMTQNQNELDYNISNDTEDNFIFLESNELTDMIA